MKGIPDIEEVKNDKEENKNFIFQITKPLDLFTKIVLFFAFICENYNER